MESEIKKSYTDKDVFRLGKRDNNKKRSYILVNPLQGKHIPVSPSKALEMMNVLGEKVARQFPKARLAIGFAETATAIGVAVAFRISENCVYLQTTRENVVGAKKWVNFWEEHSHAPEQKLVADNLEEFLENTDSIIFVDDEISTGKTLLNIIKQMKTVYPMLDDKKLVAASVINRLTDKDEERLKSEGIFPIYLTKIPATDYTSIVNEWTSYEAENLPITADYPYETYYCSVPFDSRKGARIGDYVEAWESAAKDLTSRLPLDFSAETLTLGTEECMMPGLIIGKALEDCGCPIWFHATTRSPISICDLPEYPIKNGWRVKSLYDETGYRPNFIYNLRAYPQVLIVSDALNGEHKLQSLIQVLKAKGCGKIFFVGSENVV